MDRSEEREQAKFVRWCSLPDVRTIAPALAFLFHCPNGGQRNAITGAQMTALGVKRGVPDLLLPFHTKRHHGLAIEFKSASGTATPQQDAWLAFLRQQNWSCSIARSAFEAMAIVAGYLEMPLLLSIALP